MNNCIKTNLIWLRMQHLLQLKHFFILLSCPDARPDSVIVLKVIWVNYSSSFRHWWINWKRMVDFNQYILGSKYWPGFYSSTWKFTSLTFNMSPSYTKHAYRRCRMVDCTCWFSVASTKIYTAWINTINWVAFCSNWILIKKCLQMAP